MVTFLLVFCLVLLPIFPGEAVRAGSPYQQLESRNETKENGSRTDEEGGAEKKEIPPLSVAFIWEMHLPLTSRPKDGLSLLPDFTQTALQDYIYFFRMLAEDFPEQKLNLAVSPSLIAQFQSVREGEHSEYLTEILKEEDLAPPARPFVEREVERIPSRLIDRFPAYEELSGRLLEGRELSGQELIDLKTYLRLYWIHPGLIAGDALLTQLADKGGNYTYRELTVLLKREEQLLRRGFDYLERLLNRDNIELVASPLYSPILPLLYERGWDEDAEAQIAGGLEIYEDLFDLYPRGFYPPRGAVSEKLGQNLFDHGLFWLVTDMSVLREAGKNVVLPDTLYRPYLVGREGEEIAVFFRDTDLAHRIRYGYQDMSPEAAVNDFLGRLHELQRLNTDGDMIVTIALESGAYWRYYRDRGRQFRRLLMEKIDQDQRIELVTLTNFLRENGVKSRLDQLPDGSNIGDLSLWTEAPDQKAAWERLAKLREQLADSGHDQTALDLYYRAQAGEWFKTYGEPEIRDYPVFDRLFKDLLLAAYRKLDREKEASDLNFTQFPGAPELKVPFFSGETPRIDGRLSFADEWKRSAGVEEPGVDFLGMENNLFIRVTDGLVGFGPETSLSIYISGPEGAEYTIYPRETRREGSELQVFSDLGFGPTYHLSLPAFGKGGGGSEKTEEALPVELPVEIFRGGQWEKTGSTATAFDDDFLEIKLPGELISGRDEIKLRFVVSGREGIVYYPLSGPLTIRPEL